MGFIVIKAVMSRWSNSMGNLESSFLDQSCCFNFIFWNKEEFLHSSAHHKIKVAVLGYFLFLYSHLANSSELNMADFPEYPHKEEVQSLAVNQNKFTRDLYQVLSKEKSGNLFFSPFSISAGLAMVYMGSKGKTKSQMESLLHFPLDKSVIRKAFHDLMDDYKKQHEEYELRTSNMLYVSDTLSVQEEFISALTEDFLASSKLVDFSEPEPVRVEINAKVEKETNSKIKDLIAPDILGPLTRMVLVNAIYFKGLWLHQFNPDNTQNKPFWVTPVKSVDVPMMTVEKNFRISPKPELNATLLALDYKGGRLSMVILLPNEKNGLAALEEKLASVNFESLDRKAATAKVSVTLPKFKLEETLQLIPILQSMGLTSLFTSESDLSEISEQEGLCVSHVIHKAFLEVNEEGSEAAAATGVVMARRALIGTSRFVADRPFSFYIRDNRAWQILFSGRFAQPQNWQEQKEEL